MKFQYCGSKKNLQVVRLQVISLPTGIPIPCVLCVTSHIGVCDHTTLL